MNSLDRHAHLCSQVLLSHALRRQELVQRRIEETNGGWEALEFLEDPDEKSDF